MLYKDFKGDNISQLGYGLMRLPVLENGEINEAETERLIDTAMHAGINYYDTAYPYHMGQSELVIGKILKKYDRKSFYLADKFPGHQISDTHEPAPVFEEQLLKCQVDYFDYYLLHNVTEGSLDVYLDPKWGIVDYLAEQKKLGRIRHLGFSSHGDINTIKTFLDKYADQVEFCQLQINYVDWNLQQSKEKYELIKSYGLGIWVMEPVRGGRLVDLNDEYRKLLADVNNFYEPVELCFRFIQSLADVNVTLSGMTTMEQLENNIGFYQENKPLTQCELDKLQLVSDKMTKLGPQCSACHYCDGACPADIDISKVMKLYNDLLFANSVTIGMKIDAMPDGSRPSDCIGCGCCKAICPQHLDIPFVMKDITERLAKFPSWADMCKAREEAAKNLNIKK